MFASHAPALCLALVDDALSVARLLLLGGAEAFFLLKVVDVRWLRIPPRSHARNAVIVGFVLLHAQAIERNLAHDLNSPVSWQLVVLGGGLTFAGLSRRSAVNSNGGDSKDDSSGRTAHIARARLADAGSNHRLPQRFLSLERASLVDRAPPPRAHFA
ncbi:MAG: hypothetical protein HRF50_11325 [Phycisphaerae bacterium]